MSQVAHIVKFAAKTTFVAISRVVLIIVLGIVLNLTLLFLLPDMCNLTRGEAGLMDYIGQIAQGCSGTLIFGLLFILFFPILYYFIAQKYGVQKALQYAYVQNKNFFYEYFASKVTGIIANKKLPQNTWVSATARLLDKMDNVPFIFRWILGFLKDKIPFASIIEKIVAKTDLSNLPPKEAAVKIATEADQYVEDELLQPDPTLFIILIILNLGVFGLAHWLY